jgi:hypothetical protein
MLFDAKQRASPGGSSDRKPLEGPGQAAEVEALSQATVLEGPGQEAEPEAEKAFLSPAASTPEAGPEPAALAARLLARKRKRAPEGEESPAE